MNISLLLFFNILNTQAKINKKFIIGVGLLIFTTGVLINIKNNKEAVENYDKTLTELINNIKEEALDGMLDKSPHKEENKNKLKASFIENKIPVNFLEVYNNILKSSNKELENIKKNISNLLIDYYNSKNESLFQEYLNRIKLVINMDLYIKENFIYDHYKFLYTILKNESFFNEIKEIKNTEEQTFIFVQFVTLICNIKILIPHQNEFDNFIEYMINLGDKDPKNKKYTRQIIEKIIVKIYEKEILKEDFIKNVKLEINKKIKY